MTQIVKCLICGKEKEVLNNSQKSFTCCRTRQPIDERTKLNPINPENDLLIQKEKQEIKNSPELQDLEIENDIPQNPIEEIKEVEENKTFNCPNCQNQLNEYETPCPKCFYEIEWR